MRWYRLWCTDWSFYLKDCTDCALVTHYCKKKGGGGQKGRKKFGTSVVGDQVCRWWVCTERFRLRDCVVASSLIRIIAQTCCSTLTTWSPNIANRFCVLFCFFPGFFWSSELQNKTHWIPLVQYTNSLSWQHTSQTSNCIASVLAAVCSRRLRLYLELCIRFFLITLRFYLLSWHQRLELDDQCVSR